MPKNNWKLAAKISLIILLLSVVFQFITYYQTQYQLVSPLIPKGIILEIVKPNIFMGFVTTLVSVGGLLLYFFEKYLFVVIVAGLTLSWQQFYPYFAAS